MVRSASERTIVFLVGAVQFVNILDFMIVMPLGPDFATALGIPTSHLGYVGGSYTLAAAAAGLLGAAFLDRFDRRQALGCAMAGLVLGTLAGAFAVGLRTLLLARVVAGLFGGPATSLAYSIVADAIPPARRGRAMGAVMGAFSAASVAGVPAGLELARRGGWRLPFLAVAALGALVTVLAYAALPPLRGHLGAGAPGGGAAAPRLRLRLLARPLVFLSYAMTAMSMMATFVLVPNISAYVQYNLGYPRASLGTLYLVGGAVSFGAMRLVGRLVDRLGAFGVSTLGASLLLAVLYFGFVAYRPGLPVVVVFVGLMVAMPFRTIPANTLTSQVPLPAERASFMSAQSATQHLASALGAFLSAHMLRELPDRSLAGIPRVAAVSMALTMVIPVAIWLLETRVRRRDAAVRSEAS